MIFPFGVDVTLSGANTWNSLGGIVLTGASTSWETRFSGPSIPSVSQISNKSMSGADLRTCCPQCNADVDDWVLCIEDNKITGFAPEFKKRVEYVFQDPFVEIDGQLINWDTFCSRQMLELFQQRLNESEHPEWPLLQAALEESIMMKRQTIAAEFCTGWLLAVTEIYYQRNNSGKHSSLLRQCSSTTPPGSVWKVL